MGFVTMVPLILDMKSGSGSMQSLGSNVFLALVDWIMCKCSAKRDQEFPRTAKTFFPVVPICMGLCSVWGTKQFLAAWASQTEHEVLKREVSSNTEFIRA